MDQPTPLRYLTAADVAAAMPPLDERLALAETTLRGLAGAAELPPKIGVHPREAGSFSHAMPAYLPGPGEAAGDLLGMKWVLGFGSNAGRGLANINALLILNDPVTGLATAILDAGPITAQRTAAVSGVAIRAWSAPADRSRPSAALIGAGVQGHSHAPVLAGLLPGVDIAVFDRDTARAEALAAAAAGLEGVAGAHVCASAREAADGADVVITAVSFAGPSERQVMTNDWLAPNALVIPVDYATMCAAEVARDAALFVTDHTDQFLANREAGQFDGYPEPEAMIGAVLDQRLARPDGRIVVTHLGTGLADVVFGSAIVARAEQLGLGTLLPR
jgi:ornithine cyclodeaminase/alanine dehydrogenase-like protein (mu-crystallin family)